MAWQIPLALIFGSLLVLIASGMPIAFCFMLVNVLGAIFLWGGEAGLSQLSLSIQAGVGTFILLPAPLFILMGEILFLSGVGLRLIETLDLWIGRLPGRLAFLAVIAGTLLATMTGASISSCAMLGSVLTPEMEKRGYKKAMSLGPIMGSGCLAMMIPPSALAVLLCAIGQISVGKTLIAIILPGLVMAILYASYIFLRCYLQPSIAPKYDMPPTPLLVKLIAAVRYVLPTGIVIFGVIGTMFLGIAGPTEASALGAIATCIVAAQQKGLNRELVRALKQSIMNTVQISVMVCMIISGAVAFSQILAFSGASQGLVEFVVGLPVAPIFTIMIMMFVALIFGCFLEPGSIMMVCLPTFVLIIKALGFDPVWFGVMFLITVEMGMLTPPFGLILFVMKGVAPRDTVMSDIIQASTPFIAIDMAVMALVMAFPKIALFLPSLMRAIG